MVYQSIPLNFHYHLDKGENKEDETKTLHLYKEFNFSNAEVLKMRG